MTCIVGLECNGRVLMGGDSAAAEGWNMRLATAPKVFRKQNLLIGYTWSWRMGQIIQYAPGLPELSEHSDNYTYLVESFVPFIRKAFRDAGWLKTENSRDEGGQFMIGIRGEIFIIHSDFSVLRGLDGFDAIGCGAPYALGSLRALTPAKAIDGPNIIKTALEIAAYFSNGVSAPFVFEEL